ncbi:hypothetical protein ES703_64270 [subsurface metagenome]
MLYRARNCQENIMMAAAARHHAADLTVKTPLKPSRSPISEVSTTLSLVFGTPLSMRRRLRTVIGKT